jgi:hypothetical protein
LDNKSHEYFARDSQRAHERYLFLANQILSLDKVAALVERVLDGAGRIGVNVEFINGGK